MVQVRLITLAVFLVTSMGQQSHAEAALPRPDHIVVVVMENHGLSQVTARDAPFIATLASQGATFTNSFAITHPSQPNYFALFAGSTEGVEDNGVYDFDVATLAGALARVGRRFVGYEEKGSPRKHNPWESFRDSSRSGRSFATFPADYSKLPTVSFVIPNLDNDMHDGSVNAGDAWLKNNLDSYAAWAKNNNSLLIITFDEDEGGRRSDNRIPTMIIGDHVRKGVYDQKINHYSLLRTILAMYGLPGLANSREQAPISEIWNPLSSSAVAQRLQ